MESEFPYPKVEVLVLGAAGFLGRWVARRLSTSGAKLTLVVRDESAAQPIFDRWEITGKKVLADLSKPGSGSKLVEEFRPQVVFNLAGYGVDRSEENPELGKRINADLTVELATAITAVPAGAWAGQRLIHAGSAFEYGGVHGDLSESGPAEPTSWYGETKLAATQALTELRKSQGLAAIIARLFTVYGPGEHPGRLLPSLIAASRAGETLCLTAGTQQRDFTYVGDVAEGLLRLGACHIDDDVSAVVNLCTGRLHSVRQFVEIAAAELGLPRENLRFGAIPQRGNEMVHDPANTQRLQTLTEWTPQTTVDAGVRRTWQFESGSEGDELNGI